MPSCRGAPRRHPPSTQRVASHNDGRSRPAGGRAARSRRPSGRALSTASQEHLSRLLESESVLQRTRAWLVYAGLTLPLGLLAHVLVEAVGGVARRTGSVSLQHTLLALVAGTAFAAALAALRRAALSPPARGWPSPAVRCKHSSRPRRSPPKASASIPRIWPSPCWRGCWRCS